MRPEQARGKPIDHRADVWALGVITYHLLTTEFPFDGKTPEELFERLTRVQPFAITEHRQDLPPSVTELFAKAFAKKVEDRFQSAEAFASALERIAGNRPDVLFSLPPSGPKLAPTPLPTETKEPSEIVAAGVPRSNNRQLVVAAVVLLAAAAAFTIGYGRFGRDGGAPSGLTAGASTLGTSGALPPDRTGDTIPPPEPVAAPAEPKTREPNEPALEPAPEAAAMPAAIEPAPPPVLVAPTTPAPAKTVDKSQVF